MLKLMLKLSLLLTLVYADLILYDSYRDGRNNAPMAVFSVPNHRARWLPWFSSRPEWGYTLTSPDKRREQFISLSCKRGSNCHCDLTVGHETPKIKCERYNQRLSRTRSMESPERPMRDAYGNCIVKVNVALVFSKHFLEAKEELEICQSIPPDRQHLYKMLPLDYQVRAPLVIKFFSVPTSLGKMKEIYSMDMNMYPVHPSVYCLSNCQCFVFLHSILYKPLACPKAESVFRGKQSKLEFKEESKSNWFDVPVYSEICSISFDLLTIPMYETQSYCLSLGPNPKRMIEPEMG